MDQRVSCPWITALALGTVDEPLADPRLLPVTPPKFAPPLPARRLTLAELQWPLRRAPVPVPTDMLHSSSIRAHPKRSMRESADRTNHDEGQPRAEPNGSRDDPQGPSWQTEVGCLPRCGSRCKEPEPDPLVKECERPRHPSHKRRLRDRDEHQTEIKQ
jgi:hypothetical protein